MSGVNGSVEPARGALLRATVTTAEFGERRRDLQSFVVGMMVLDRDYRLIDRGQRGEDPQLLKPGADLLCTRYGLIPAYELLDKVEDWHGKGSQESLSGPEPLFHYHYKCVLWAGEKLAGEGEGSCSSFEPNYRWRWVDESYPGVDREHHERRESSLVEFAFAIEKGDTTGHFAKPAAYWETFREAIDAGQATKTKKRIKSGELKDAWALSTVEYRIPNPDVCDQVNTYIKMSRKRALIEAVQAATDWTEAFPLPEQPSAGRQQRNAKHSAPDGRKEQSGAAEGKKQGEAAKEKDASEGPIAPGQVAHFKQRVAKGKWPEENVDVLLTAFTVKRPEDLKAAQWPAMLDALNKGPGPFAPQETTDDRVSAALDKQEKAQQELGV